MFLREYDGIKSYLNWIEELDKRFIIGNTAALRCWLLISGSNTFCPTKNHLMQDISGNIGGFLISSRPKVEYWIREVLPSSGAEIEVPPRLARLVRPPRPAPISPYTRSPSQGFRLFEPRPWQILATTCEQKRFLSNPDPDENLVSGNLVMETGCTRLASLGLASTCLARRKSGFWIRQVICYDESYNLVIWYELIWYEMVPIYISCSPRYMDYYADLIYFMDN